MKGVSKSVQVLLNGIQAVTVLILDNFEITSPASGLGDLFGGFLVVGSGHVADSMSQSTEPHALRTLLLSASIARSAALFRSSCWVLDEGSAALSAHQYC